MAPVLRRGRRGQPVERLQRALKASGFAPGAIDGHFGPATAAALIGFQRAHGLLADGIAGPLTWARLEGGGGGAPADVTGQLTVELVADMFPFTRLDAIARNLPFVVDGLRRFAVVEAPLVLMALATIRAETETFEPIDELPSRFNTSPTGHPFDLYDNRIDLGNRGRPDGTRYRGRGFVQLTGRASYAELGRLIGAGSQLEQQPERAGEPVTAALVLAACLAARRLPIKEALLDGDLGRARRLVNGGRHGLERFVEAFRVGQNRIVDDVWWPRQPVSHGVDDYSVAVDAVA